MSDTSIISVRRLADGTVVQVHGDGSTTVLNDDTDYDALARLSDDKIDRAAASDPDNPPVSDDELSTFRTLPNPKDIRKRLNLTQEEFAQQFHLRLGTIRDWEQGKKRPDSAAMVLLRVIEAEPEAVLRALSA